MGWHFPKRMEEENEKLKGEGFESNRLRDIWAVCKCPTGRADI
jgi:hypothetical protein